MTRQTFNSDSILNGLSGRVILVLSLFVLCIFYYAYFILEKRLPLGHDTLQYLQLQYTFLNDLIINGELPLWFPFMTKGTVTNIWFVIQNGLLNNLYYVLAPFLKDINYYYLFYLSFFFDEIILLIGTYLLSRSLYKNNWAVLFVMITILGTINWASQVWWNFHLYYLMPLVMFLYMKALREKSVSFFLLANLFLFLWSFCGNLVYYIPLFSFFIFLFFLSYATCNFYKGISLSIEPIKTEKDSEKTALNLSVIISKNILQTVRASFTSKNCLTLATVLIISAIPFFVTLKYITQSGAGEIVYSNIDRDKSGLTPLTTFLTYGGLSGYGKYIEFFSGVTKSLDNSLFVGSLTISLSLLQIVYIFKKINSNKIALAILVSMLLMISFSSGGIVASLAYFSWPMMKYFRHVGHTGPIIKVMVIFLAGFAVDQIISIIRHNDKQHFFISIKYLTVFFIFALMVKILFIVFPERFSWELFSSAKQEISSFKVISLLIVLSYLLLMASKNKLFAAKAGGVILFAALLLHGAELGFLRSSYYDIQLPKQKTDNYFRTFSFQSYPYVASRNQNYEENIRYSAFSKASFLDVQYSKEKILNRWGALYWNSDSFFFLDSCSTPFRADHRLNSIDDFYRVYQDKTSSFNIEKPMPTQKAFLKILGCGYPKLQGFSTIYYTKHPKDLMIDPHYRGDILFTDTKNEKYPSLKMLPENAPSFLEKNDRVNLEATVRHFSANRLGLDIVNSSSSHAFLHYADAYHKYWKAYVNGEKKDILRSNLGFKAVQVPPGSSSVEFVFREPKVVAATYFLITLGLLGITAIVSIMALILMNRWGKT